jgi:hypothetical protein
MEDFTKELLATKQTSWLTNNRFWNLFFLFAVPTEIYLAALMWSAWMLLLPLATIIAIFAFVPVDKSAVSNREPQAMKAVKYAAYIWVATIIAFGFAGSKILSLIGLELGQFGFGEVVFFIFLIPISILCYFDIPLSSCVEATDPKDIYSIGSQLSVGDSRTSLSTRSRNWTR